MKRKIVLVFIIIVFVYSLLSAITIPYSEKEFKSESNCLYDFVRIKPDDKVQIPLQTKVWLWHDNENIFVLWEVKINKDFEKGKYANRDVWTQADFLRVQLITDTKNFYSYSYYIYPLGNKYDAIREENMQLNTLWNSNYDYKNTISDTLWKSIVKIPFKDLRFYGKPPYNWKIILTRYLQKPDEFYSYPYGTTKMGKDYFRKAADIKIREKIKKNKNCKLIPYIIKKYNMIDKTTSFDPKNIGLDFSYNPTTGTKLKLSFNPDFSDIPMDSENDNFNSRFAIFLPENRYFFIEDIDVFGTNDNVFYSRQIIQPQFAIKLTGNTDKLSYGFLSAKDKKIIQDGELINNDDLYNLLALRPKWKTLSLQMTLLNRIDKDYDNEVLLLKPNWEVIKNHSISTELITSFINGKNEKNRGYAVNSEYAGKIKDFTFYVNGTYRSKDYDIKTGQIYENNVNIFSATIYQDTDTDSKFISSFGNRLNLNTEHKNYSNDLMFDMISIFSYLTFKPKFGFDISFQKVRESYQNKLYYLWYSGFGFNVWKYNFININYRMGLQKEIIYSLSCASKSIYFDLKFSGNIGNYFSYNFSFENKKYPELKKNDYFDNAYSIINLDITTSISNKISLSNGLRYNNYQTIYSNSYIGFFSNLNYEYKENCYLYLGYKTAQDEISNRYEPDYRIGYIKISYTF